MRLAAHPEIVRQAGQAHCRELLRALETDQLSSAGRVAGERLIASIDAALGREAAVEANDLPFSWRDMDDVLPRDLEHLIDQHYYGVGNDGAEVIFMGTEEGYGTVTPDDRDRWLRTLRGLGFGSCGFCLVWLTDSSPVVLECLAGPELFDPHSPWAWHAAGPYQRHPYDYHAWRRGNGTWRVLAKLMSLVRGGIGDVDLAGPADPGVPRPRLGDITFQIDRSAKPSPTARGGSAPSKARLRFLEELLTACRPTARVLVIHGAAYGSTETEKWAAANQRLADAFLGGAIYEWAEIPATPRARILMAASAGHAVFRTRALNGPDASTQLLRALAGAMAQALRRTPPGRG
jgi:hypothetical protein